MPPTHHSSHRNSPFRRPSSVEQQQQHPDGLGGVLGGGLGGGLGGVVARRPPLPQRCGSVDRSQQGQEQVRGQGHLLDRPGSSCSLQLPDFLQGKQDMGKVAFFFFLACMMVKRKKNTSVAIFQSYPSPST